MWSWTLLEYTLSLPSPIILDLRMLYLWSKVLKPTGSKFCWCFFMFTSSSFLQEHSNKIKISLGTPLGKHDYLHHTSPTLLFSGCTHAMPMWIIKDPKIKGPNFDGVCFFICILFILEKFHMNKIMHHTEIQKRKCLHLSSIWKYLGHLAQFLL